MDERPWNAQDKARWIELDSMAPADLVKRCFESECKLNESERRYQQLAKGLKYDKEGRTINLETVESLQSRLDAETKLSNYRQEVLDTACVKNQELQGRLHKRESGLRDVMRHLEIASPTGYKMSGAWNIANIALEEPLK
jgi:hypothetical protein